MDWNIICRTCLSTKDSLESIFSSPDPLALDYEYTASYSDMIKAVTSVCITPNDTFPQNICHKCINGVLIAFNFQKITIKTEEALRALKVPKIEEIIEDPLSSNHPNNIYISDEQITNEILSVKSSLLNGKIKVKDPSLTHNPQQQNKNPIIKQDTQQSTNKEFKVICKKFEMKIKARELLRFQKERETRLKQTSRIKTIQINDNVSPPPLVFLSESKNTPPPLLVLPNKTIEPPPAIVSKQNQTHYCNFCEETYVNVSEHFEWHYMKFICNKCHIKYDTVVDFQNHLKEHLNFNKNGTFYYCKLCYATFDNSVNIQAHIDVCSPVNPELVNMDNKQNCRVCGIRLSTDEDVCNLCKKNDKYICPFCGKEFTDANLLARHERKHN